MSPEELDEVEDDDEVETDGKEDWGRPDDVRIRCKLVVPSYVEGVEHIGIDVTTLAGAGLVLNSFVRVLFADTGYKTTNVIAFQVRVPRDHFTPATNRKFARQLVAQIADVPGVVAAGYSTSLPGAIGAFAAEVRDRPGDAFADGASSADLGMISSGFMETMGTEIVSGSGFNMPPRSGDHRRMLINERLARVRFPGENPTIWRRSRSQGRAPTRCF